MLENGAGRVLQSYLDYAPLLVRYKTNSGRGDMGPLAQVEGNLFLGSSTIILEAAAEGVTCHGLVVTGNQFHTWNAPNSTFVVDESGGSFGGVEDVIVENNVAGSAITHGVSEAHWNVPGPPPGAKRVKL